MPTEQVKREKAIAQTILDESLLGHAGEASVARASTPASTTQEEVDIIAPATTTRRRRETPATTAPVNLADNIPTNPTFDVPGLDDSLQPAVQAVETTDMREAAQAVRDTAQSQRAEAIRRQQEQQEAEIQQAEQVTNAQFGIDTPADAHTPEVTATAVETTTRTQRRPAQAKSPVQNTPPIQEAVASASAGTTSENARKSRPLVSRDLVQRLTALNHLDADHVERQMESLLQELLSWNGSVGVARDAKLLNLALVLAPILEG